MVAAPAAGVVVRRARGAGGTFADRAGRRQLAGAVLVSAAAAVELLGERTQLVVLRTIQEGLEVTQPVGPRPGREARERERFVIDL